MHLDAAPIRPASKPRKYLSRVGIFSTRGWISHRESAAAEIIDARPFGAVGANRRHPAGIRGQNRGRRPGLARNHLRLFARARGAPDGRGLAGRAGAGRGPDGAPIDAYWGDGSEEPAGSARLDRTALKKFSSLRAGG